MIRLAFRRLLQSSYTCSNDISQNGMFYFRARYLTTTASSEVQYQEAANLRTRISNKGSITSFPKSLGQLETAVEDYGHSVASFSTQVQESKKLLSSILSDVEVLKSQFGCSGCKLLSDDGQDSKETLTSKPQYGSRRSEFHILDAADGDVSFPNTQRQSNDFNVLPDILANDDSGSISSGSSSVKLTQWTLLLEHLRTFPKVAQQGQNNNSKTIRRMLSTFSQEHEWIFSSLSSQHLQVLAEYGCPTDDRRTIASGKRLRNHLHIEEISICESCELRDICGSAFVKPANVQANLSDVLRLISSIFEVTTCKKKGLIPDNLRSSIVNILEEIINLSSRHQDGDRLVQEDHHNNRFQENILSEQNASCIDADPPRCIEHGLQLSENNSLKLGGPFQNATNSDKPSVSTMLGCVRRKEQLLQEMLLTVQHSHPLVQTTEKGREDSNTVEDVISDSSNANIRSAFSGDIPSHTLPLQQTFVNGNLTNDEHSSIFDHIVEFGDTDSSPTTNDSGGNQLSLSELIKRNVNAFVPCRDRTDVGKKEARSYKEFEDHSVKEKCFDGTMTTRFSRGRDASRPRTIHRHAEDQGVLHGRDGYDKMNRNELQSCNRSVTKHRHVEDYGMQYGSNSYDMMKRKELPSSNDKRKFGRKGCSEDSFKKNDRKLRRDREPRGELGPW